MGVNDGAVGSVSVRFCVKVNFDAWNGACYSDLRLLVRPERIEDSGWIYTFLRGVIACSRRW